MAPGPVHLRYPHEASHFLFHLWHRMLMNVFDKAPSVEKETFVAPSVSLVGDVHVGQGSSIWYGCVLRDANNINVEAGTNIQDNALVHVAKSNLSGKVLPNVIGDNVIIAPHGSRIMLLTYGDEDIGISSDRYALVFPPSLGGYTVTNQFAIYLEMLPFILLHIFHVLGLSRA